MSRTMSPTPRPQAPMFVAIAMVNSALIMGLVAWFLAGPLKDEIVLGPVELVLILAWFAAGVGGMFLTFSAAKMRGWVLANGTISSDGSGGAGGVDTAGSYIQRAYQRFILGASMVESGAAIGLVSVVALKQTEMGMAMIALSVIGVTKLMFPALQIMRRSTALAALEAAALSVDARTA